ncbi:MAG: hypothetical protein P1P81_10785, partial [Desulfobulbales bacterium]|nr:hypothetical protein [Desulfobulbales bacterium]
MKKALSFAVALGLVAGYAATASAVTMDWAGDARWRGIYRDNANFDDTKADLRQRMDQRYRIFGTLNVNDDVKISTRIVLADQVFGNNFGIDVDGNGTNDGLKHYVDRAHMTIKMLGGSYLIGRQNASWGNKFLGWGSQVDRIKAVYKSGDLTYGGYLQKKLEGNDPYGDGDIDIYGAFVVGKAGDTKWGVLPNYIYSDTHSAVGGGSEDGYLVDAFFTTKAGPAAIMGELVYSGGDLGENSDGDSFYGGFVGGAMGMDAVTVKGLVAYYQGNDGNTGSGRSCDNDFAPSLLIGTCQETAIINFGSTTNPNKLVAEADDSTYLVGAGVDFKVNDKLTLGALVGYLMASENGVGGDDATLVEYDLSARYQ